MSVCAKCKSSIRGESGIRCEGVCGKNYHESKTCSGVDKYSTKILGENNMIRFMCDECITYVQNIDLVLQDMHMSVKKNNSILNEYKNEFDGVIKKSQDELKLLLEAIEVRYAQRMLMMEKSQQLFEKKIGEVKSLYEMIEEVKIRTEKIGKESEKVQNEMKRISKSTNELNSSYADVLKNKKKRTIAEPKNDVALIVKPKSKQTGEKTKKDLSAKVDPKNLKISSIATTNNGVMIIQSDNIDERDKIREAIENNIGCEYEIKIPKPILPRFLITGINFKYEQKDLLESLQKQNPSLSLSTLTVVKQYERKKDNRSYYNAIIEINNVEFVKVIEAESLNLGWERCKVFDAVNVLMCFKCKGFNHKLVDCKNDEACQKCHGNHNSKLCNENPIMKCLNCIRANNDYNMALDINHDTLDKNCPCYKHKLELRRKKLGY